MAIPSTMRAVLVPEVGGADKLQYTESEPVPVISDGQVLVKNNYAGINFVDVYYREGTYPSPKGYPLILGQEAAGEVVATKGSNLFGIKEGDRVVWIGSHGYAEYSAVPASSCIKIPEGLSDQDAVGGFLMGMTALSLVKEAFPVQKGHTVLVHAAAGGVGLLLCQLLRDIGAITIATAGGPEKCALAKENGATYAIDYRATAGPSWQEQVKDLTDGVGVDVVYDSVGKDTWQGSLDVAKRKGKVVFIVSSSGAIPPLDIGRLTPKNLSVMRPGLRQFIATNEEFEFYGTTAVTLVKDGKLKIRKHKVYDLRDAAIAHRDLEGRKTSGKCYLKL